MSSMMDISDAISQTCVFVQSARGEISTPPSPYFVFEPTPKSSTLLPVPTTNPLLDCAI
jgi:hypothetical protein